MLLAAGLRLLPSHEHACQNRIGGGRVAVAATEELFQHLAERLNHGREAKGRLPVVAATGLRLQTTAVLCTFGLDTTAATAQRLPPARNVVIPPGKFKLLVDNHAGVALNASGNTLKILPYNVNLNG